MKKMVISGIRFFLGWTFFSAGMSKLIYPSPFPGWIGPSWLIERLEEYQLGLYAWFIAISQVVIGLLLLTRRFATLGSIMLVPMLLNILMITISQQWQGTPYVVAVLLIMNLLLLLDDYPRLRFLLADDPGQLPPQPLRRRNIRYDMVCCLGFVLITAGAACMQPWPLPGQLLAASGGVVLVGLSGYAFIQKQKGKKQPSEQMLKKV